MAEAKRQLAQFRADTRDGAELEKTRAEIAARAGKRSSRGLGDSVGANVTVGAAQMCAEVRRRARGGLWSYPNSGVFAGSVHGVRAAFERLRRHALDGHFEDRELDLT